MNKQRYSLITSGFVLPKYISGPVSFSHYFINGVDLLLFGDEHNDNSGMCQKCSHLDPISDIPIIKHVKDDCYTLSAWIQSILEQMNGSEHYLDLYVEDYFIYLSKKTRVPPKYYESFSDGRLKELIKFYRHCKDCNNLRYHLIDFRIHKLNQNGQIDITTRYNVPLAKMIVERAIVAQNEEDIVEEVIDFFLLKENILKIYAFIAGVSINYEANLESMIQGYRIKHQFHFLGLLYQQLLDDLISTKLIVKKYGNMRLHPIGKQFQKLKEQQMLFSNLNNSIQIDEMVKFIIDIEESEISEKKLRKKLYKTIRYVKNQIMSEPQIYIREKELQGQVTKLANFFNLITTHIFIMDLYAIPRILYNYQNSIIKIYSAGDVHIEVLERFLNQFYPESHIKTVRPIKRESTRCVNTLSEYRTKYEPVEFLGKE